MKSNLPETAVVVSLVIFALSLFVNVVEETVYSSQDARTMIQAESTPAIALLYHSDKTNYDGICDYFRDQFETSEINMEDDFNCQDYPHGWAMRIDLHSTKTVCLSSEILTPIIIDSTKPIDPSICIT